MRGTRSGAGWVGWDSGNDAGDGADAFRGSIQGRIVECMLKALGTFVRRVLDGRWNQWGCYRGGDVELMEG